MGQQEEEEAKGKAYRTGEERREGERRKRKSRKKRERNLRAATKGRLS